VQTVQEEFSNESGQAICKQGSVKVVAQPRSLAPDRQISRIGRQKAIGDCTQSDASRGGPTATLTVPYAANRAIAFEF